MEAKVFSCNLGDVRVIVNDSEPLFCAYDVCRILDYKNGRDTIKRLFGGCVAKYYAGVEIGKKPDGKPIIQDREMTFLTEPQLYKLIMRSNAKNAENIQKWICEEVMPSIKGGEVELRNSKLAELPETQFPTPQNYGAVGQSAISFDVEVETDNSIVGETYNRDLSNRSEALPILKNVIGDAEVNSVNARDLHKSLESKQQFADWIKARIGKLNLIENVDFITLRNQTNKGFGGDVKSVDYIITLDIAKHFCMLEMTDKGHRVRQYFIECEKQLQKTQIDMSDPKVLLNQVIELAQKQLVLIEENEKLVIENKEQKQLIEYQGDNLNSYKQVEKARRSKAELKATFNRKVRLLAEQKFNRDYPRAYQFVYGIFANTHNITEKINMAYIGKNIDYLAECVEIVLSELD